MLNRFLSWRLLRIFFLNGGLWIKKGINLQKFEKFGNIGWTYVYSNYTIVPMFVVFWGTLYSIVYLFEVSDCILCFNFKPTSQRCLEVEEKCFSI